MWSPSVAHGQLAESLELTRATCRPFECAKTPSLHSRGDVAEHMNECAVGLECTAA